MSEFEHPFTGMTERQELMSELLRADINVSIERSINALRALKGFLDLHADVNHIIEWAQTDGAIIALYSGVVRVNAWVKTLDHE